MQLHKMDSWIPVDIFDMKVDTLNMDRILCTSLPSLSSIDTVAVLAVLLTTTTPVPVRVTVKFSVSSTMVSSWIGIFLQALVSPAWKVLVCVSSV